MRRKIYIALLFIAFAPFAKGQADLLSVAVERLNAGEVELAKSAIDSAIASAPYDTDPQAWYVRGFIYKELYLRKERQTMGIQSRREAIGSFRRSMELDNAGEHTRDNKDNLNLIATSLHNDAAILLKDTVRFELAVPLFEMYRQTMLIADPSFNLQKKDIEFYLALGSAYDRVIQSRTEGRAPWLAKSAETYRKVLAADSSNVSANYCTGILYYNLAVDIIKAMDVSTDIVKLEEIQDTCLVLFRKALPFMEKAHALDPDRVETLIALSAIYGGLYSFDKQKIYLLKLTDIYLKSGNMEKYKEFLEFLAYAYLQLNDQDNYKAVKEKLAGLNK